MKKDKVFLIEGANKGRLAGIAEVLTMEMGCMPAFLTVLNRAKKAVEGRGRDRG